VRVRACPRFSPVQDSFFALQAAPDHVCDVRLHLTSEICVYRSFEVGDQLAHELDVIVTREQLGPQHSLAYNNY
jgi:hypothetical protein